MPSCPRHPGRRQRPDTTDERHWTAVLARDRRQDGRFVYAVTTTGIYCRPSCPSRRPGRANVTFHAGPAAAEAAGYRACRRCRPDRLKADGTAAATADEARKARIVAAACRLIDDAEEPLPLAALAARLDLGPHRLHRLFRQSLGVTPKAYGEARRRARVGEALRDGATVTEAAHGAGYGSSGRFYAAAEATLGMTPRAYRAGGAGTEIRFAIGQTSLGAVLVAEAGPDRARPESAATLKGGAQTGGTRGICAILLGDEPEPLVRDLERRFPGAVLIGADRGFERLVAAVVGLVERPANPVPLPLAIRGTAFQQRVWEALRQIPPGRTASYAEIARRVGRPAAVRAIAAACAANPLAVAVPCHRVVRSDGGLAGYRWGIARKRALLERERDGG